MAKADIKMPADFLLKLSRLGSNMDSIAETVLEAGGEVVLEKVQGNLSCYQFCNNRMRYIALFAYIDLLKANVFFH